MPHSKYHYRLIDAGSLSDNTELGYECSYCTALALVYCEDNNKYLCHQHTGWHRDNEEWLDLVNLITEVESSQSVSAVLENG